MHPRTRKFPVRGALIALVVLLASAAPHRAVGSPSDPMAEVKQGVDDVLAVFHDQAMPLKTRREKLRELSGRYFDFEDMARSALGYHWRTLTPAQRAEFVPLFATFIQDAYLSKLADSTVRKVQDEARTAKISFTHERVDGSDYAEVFSDIALTDQKDPLQVNYLMHRRDGTWLIYDVTVDAISVIANYRNQINRVINNSGYDQLVVELKSKQAQLEQLMDRPAATESDEK